MNARQADAALAGAPLRLAELVAALSLATDLGTGQLMEHALRVCLLAVELGGELGLSEQERGDESDPTLRAIAGVLAENIPDARFVELAHCGHVTYAEQPAAFA
ncbi:MAG TPA: hypothetical protein VID73_13245, partial [Ktedonobacterales bacterium]